MNAEPASDGTATGEPVEHTESHRISKRSRLALIPQWCQAVTFGMVSYLILRLLFWCAGWSWVTEWVPAGSLWVPYVLGVVWYAVWYVVRERRCEASVD